MLREAALGGSDDSLANAIRQNDYLKRQYERRKPRGGFTMAAVPVTAHQTMGEGEFGRYYARGLCRRAIDQDVEELRSIAPKRFVSLDQLHKLRSEFW